MISRLEALHLHLHEMTSGQCINITGTFARWWPNPRLPQPDDWYASPRERAEAWADARGCDVKEGFNWGLNFPVIIFKKRGIW